MSLGIWRGNSFVGKKYIYKNRDLFKVNNVKRLAILQIMMITVIVIIKMQVFCEYLLYARHYAKYFPKVI